MAKLSCGAAIAGERRGADEVIREVQALEFLTLAQLQRKHLELFGGEIHTKNKTFLKKKLASRIQELPEGAVAHGVETGTDGLAPTQLPHKKDPKRRSAQVRTPETRPAPSHDPRLPDVGTVLRRNYQGTYHEIEVLAQGFNYLGHVHPSLSAIAKVITNTNWNGFLFFGLTVRSKNP